MALATRLKSNLEHLRRIFFSEASNLGGPYLYHAILAFRDDLRLDAIYGEKGLWRDVGGQSTIQTLNHSARVVIATEKLAVLDAPIWTEKGSGS